MYHVSLKVNKAKSYSRYPKDKKKRKESRLRNHKGRNQEEERNKGIIKQRENK